MLFSIQRMDVSAKEICASIVPVAGDESTSAQVEVEPSATRKRNPKKCTKCGKCVLNLSRHQRDVHGMRKLERKLQDYFTGARRSRGGR